MKQVASRNTGGGQHPVLKEGRGSKVMAAKKKNTSVNHNKSTTKNKSTASHNYKIPQGMKLVKIPKHHGHHNTGRKNPFNFSGDVVKVAVGVFAAIGVNYAAQMVPVDQSNPIVKGIVKAVIGVAGSVVLASKPAIAEGVLMGCGIAGGLDIASGVLPGLGAPQRQQIIQVAQNPSQQAGTPGGLTAASAKTALGAIRRQLSGGQMRGIRMVTGNPAMMNTYQYAAA